MKKLLLLLLFAGLLNTGSVFGWGREGHETIAKIAERNLTKKAKKRIEKYLGGHSIVYFAKWMDEYRHTPEYKFTNNWHTVPVNAELRYEDSMLAKNGNAIYGLEQAIENLKNYRSLTDSAVEVNLKYIIHLVGDMHCPAHIKYTTHDTKYDVLFEDKYHKPHKFPIHSVWDNEIITTTRIWSVSEWADELDRLPKAERQAVAAGTPRDWLHDNAVVCEAQFEWAKPGQRLGQDFLNEALPLIERQIRKNKTRLAKNLRAEAVLPELPEEFEAHEEGTFDIVRTKRFTVKPMSVEEAILQMNLLGHSFFVFRNTDFGDAICVVYRRNNGGYGIIETEDDEE